MVDSYKSLLPDSAGNAVVLLAQISKQLDGLSNGTHVPITAFSTSLSPESSAQQSSPPTSAVWVNSLWFLSLVISLFCALLATLQQRWARRYLGLTRPHVAIHKRAHIRSFFAEGVTRFHIHIAAEALPALLHFSVFLFLAGLVISLFTIHHTVAYVILSATVVCFLLYAAITVMPVIFHDSPYSSPFSTLTWNISRRTVVAVLNAVDHVVNFLRESKSSSIRWRSPTKTPMTMTTTPSTPARFSSYKPLLSETITDAFYTAAMRPDTERDARALGWTLDRLDEEGELVQFAAGIPGFSRSIEVDESVSILEKTPMSTELHRDLSQHVTFLLIRASKPGLLPDSKLLPESVRKRRVAICLEALYYLPHAIEKFLKRITEKPNDRGVKDVLLPVMLSVDSWLVAQRLSTAITSRVDRAVKVGARCMATLIASESRPPLNEQSRSILMQHLRIDEPDVFNHYLEPIDSLLLKNLNRFLITTGFYVINRVEAQPHIELVCLTIHLVKRLKFENAAQELRAEFERLRTRIQQSANGPPGKARDNAEELLSELSSLTTDPPQPPPEPQASGTAPRSQTWPTDAQGTAAATSPQTSQNPSWPVVQPPNDAYISIGSPVPQNDSVP